MNLDEVEALLAALRRIGGEPERVEAKRAAGGAPTSLRQTLSAFANTDGGTILLGVDEAEGFSVTPLEHPVSVRDTVVQFARDDLTPALLVGTEFVDVDGGTVLVVDVQPAASDQRPVYVTAQGIINGAYVRSGDGDRRLTQAEIALLVGARGQPQYDREAVRGTGLADLDLDALRRTLHRARAAAPKLARLDDQDAICRLGITTAADPDAALTVAGLLTFGQFPQQWFPQLMASVVVHPADPTTGVRFLDNVTARGSIPEIVETVLTTLRRHLSVRAVVGELGRTDVVEYPLEAVREAVVNALLHRDYSPVTRGTQVQVDLFPDRLVVRSPGGLFGGIGVEELGAPGVSSSRNAVLASLLCDTYLPGSDAVVAENRSSGIPTMVALTRRHGLPLPVFRSTITSFEVSLTRSELLAPAVRTWISGLALAGLTPAHEIALAMLAEGRVTAAMLREWGVERLTASQVLRDLVAEGVALKEGGRRYASYVLDPSARKGRSGPVQLTLTDPDHVPAGRPRSGRDMVQQGLRSRGAATSAELAATTGLARGTVVRALNTLVSAGVAEAVGPVRSPKRTYRWIG